MTRHRTITGFVAVALIAVAATAATMKSHPHLNDVASAGTTALKDPTVDANIPAASFDERWSAMSSSTTDSSER